MSTLKSSKNSREKICIIKDKKAKSAVVVADNPTNVAVYAAKEFVEHVHKATGVKLSVITESNVNIYTKAKYEHYIYIGVTKTALQQGIKVDQLRDNAFVIKTINTDLFVLGNEDEDVEKLLKVAHQHNHYGYSFNSLFRNDDYEGQYILEHECSWRGTLYGVYEVLERYLSIKWLWPGELGTYIPKSENFIVEYIDEIVKPKYEITNFTDFQTNLRIRELQKKYRAYHQLNSFNHPPVEHNFSNLWKTQGEKHPEWFMLNSEGNRGPKEGKNFCNMCISNKELQEFIVNEMWDGGDIIDLSESDCIEYCLCPECAAMDAPNADEGDLKYVWMNKVLSDRYTKFYKNIYDMAVKRNPNVKISTFLYWPTFHAPMEDIKLNENILGEFVPWMDKTMWFPMPDDALEHIKRQWLKWKKTGITMLFRPNYWHGGYVLPFLSIRQIGEFLKFIYENGSVGYNGDSLFGDWSTKGPMLYLHMRLLKNPETDIDEILNEYYSAFGPAADFIKQYFEYWEDHSHKVVQTESWPQWGINQIVNAPSIYTFEIFEKAESILNKALELLQNEPNTEYIERVKFIQLGLEHAKLTMRFINTLDSGKVPLNDKEKFETAKKVYNDLRSFRKINNSDEYNVPFVDLYHIEKQLEDQFIINIKKLDEEFENIKAEEKEPTPWSQWLFKKDADNVGVQKQWFIVNNETNDWTPINVPSFWEKEVGPYIGYGWYRTTFNVPESWEGMGVVLDFKGVDEEAWVYVNGEFIGEHTEASTGKNGKVIWNKPFTVKAMPTVLNYGQENTIVVRVYNSVDASGMITRIDEKLLVEKYGSSCPKTGGIHKPVLGYMPHPEKPVNLPVRR